MRLFSTSGAIITNSSFHDNAFANVYLDNADDIMFNNIQSYNNLSASYPAVDITNGSVGVSINNSMIYNSAADGISILNSASILLHNTTSVANAANGVYMDGGIDVVFSKMSIYGNMNWGVLGTNNTSAGYYNTNNIYFNNVGDIDMTSFSIFDAGSGSDLFVA